MIRAERLRWFLLGAFALGLAVSITLVETVLALLAIRWGWRLGRRRATPAGWPLAVPFALWIAASLLAAALSARPLESLVAAKGLLLIAAFYALGDALADTVEADRFLAALLGLMAGVAAVGVLQVALCPSLAPLAPVLGRLAVKCQRARGFYSIYMTLGGVLSLVLLAALARLLPGGGGGPRWRVAAWLLGGLGLLLTYVRGAWVGFVVGSGVLLGLVRRGRLLALAGVVTLALVVLVVPGVRRRAESIADPADPTARERLAMWRSGMAMAREHPLTGIGPGQVKRQYSRYVAPEFREKPRGHLHSTPMQILVERGLLGLGAWAGIFLAFFRRAARILRALPAESAPQRALVTGSMAAIAGFLVGGLTEYNFGDSEVVLTAYAVMVLPFVVERSLAGATAGVRSSGL